jgi:cystathionine beta-lyase/cystathionine gamma-synthase
MELYSGTVKLIKYFQDNLGITVLSLDLANTDKLRAARKIMKLSKTNRNPNPPPTFGQKPKEPIPEKEVKEFKEEIKQKFSFSNLVIFTESCSNPSGRIPDTQMLAKTFPEAIIIVDNSWLSPALYNPFEYGATIVLESLTKHIGGGNMVGGFVTGRTTSKLLMQKIRGFARTHGHRLGQFDALTAYHNLETLPFRLAHSGRVAFEVASALECNKTFPFIQKVCYPMLRSHQSWKMSRERLKSMFAGPPVIWLLLKGIKKDDTIRLLDSQAAKASGIKYATSYGKSVTLFDPYPKFDKHLKGTWIRLAIGYHPEITTDKTLAAITAIFEFPGKEIQELKQKP